MNIIILMYGVDWGSGVFNQPVAQSASWAETPGDFANAKDRLGQSSVKCGTLIGYAITSNLVAPATVQRRTASILLLFAVYFL
ncbi:hypothetical protein [Microbulbifer mangrovi]|uniref:hypothetical protein n=1 Tax=Microbulbifer mangrovi TaxID=927787 RepID=UPI00117CD7B4|nr:hypothetical protein [Microbulbifer mangrovi]